MKNPHAVELLVGSRVKARTHWGHITGTITKIYEAYDFQDEDGIVHVPKIAAVTVDNTPKRWPYSIPEYAPNISDLRPI